ncbi:PA2169 family four-helix-bundle protein [Hymenobacter sp. BT186]|uniref:PA2169 family four-helix-bundle protein n=1 Tax=Hymenobacter telluris TaxID=2816474 RepID=A0A939EUT8_9BACT|nr:PA2169 family four-helix-bundle protein [Hymenobacter telluris]MBO0357930.1 PA2169 family four-helix-bundle protein [Hymenobacter telluris]MBW3373957.1 PA2169 family four-helix-bundle protein [Hymenobacter norwichensis]
MEAKATQALLNELLETLKDGEKGYSEAVTDVEDHDLKEVFKKYAVQRDGYLTELEDQMHQLNLKAEEESSITGTIHRAFINLKSAITSKSRHAILAECERGEDYAKKAYETALKAEGLPGQLKSIIEKQYAGIKQGHDEIKALRDSAA